MGVFYVNLKISLHRSYTLQYMEGYDKALRNPNRIR